MQSVASNDVRNFYTGYFFYLEMLKYLGSEFHSVSNCGQRSRAYFCDTSKLFSSIIRFRAI